MAVVVGIDADLMESKAQQLGVSTRSARVGSLLLLSALLVGGCDSGGSTTPDTTPTPAEPMYRQLFTGTLPVGGSRFYAFSIATEGTINATLEDVGGPNVEPTVIVNLGIGQPAGIGCSGSATAVQASGEAGLVRMVTAVQAPGTYCVLISDAGNLAAPATFRVAIDHP